MERCSGAAVQRLATKRLGATPVPSVVVSVIIIVRRRAIYGWLAYTHTLSPFAGHGHWAVLHSLSMKHAVSHSHQYYIWNRARSGQRDTARVAITNRLRISSVLTDYFCVCFRVTLRTPSVAVDPVHSALNSLSPPSLYFSLWPLAQPQPPTPSISECDTEKSVRNQRLTAVQQSRLRVSSPSCRCSFQHLYHLPMAPCRLNQKTNHVLPATSD